MLRRFRLPILCGVIAFAAAGCNRQGSDAQAEESKTAESKRSTVEGVEFHATLLEIAAAYQKYGRFDETLRFGPPPCSAPPPGFPPYEEPKPGPSRLRVSKSRDADSHGKKLYYLYVKDGQAYAYTDIGKRQHEGQVILKEAWKPELTKDDRSAMVAFDPDDKQHYRAGEKFGLFVMMKLNPATPNTDEGWVYATISADGKTVTSAGRVESCMACHQGEGTKDRTFGVREIEPGDESK